MTFMIPCAMQKQRLVNRRMPPVAVASAMTPATVGAKLASQPPASLAPAVGLEYVPRVPPPPGLEMEACPGATLLLSSPYRAYLAKAAWNETEGALLIARDLPLRAVPSPGVFTLPDALKPAGAFLGGVTPTRSMAPSPPPVQEEDIPSPGSASHSQGLCVPCDFFHRGLCKADVTCNFCHLCGPEESKRRRKVKAQWAKTPGYIERSHAAVCLCGSSLPKCAADVACKG